MPFTFIYSYHRQRIRDNQGRGKIIIEVFALLCNIKAMGLALQQQARISREIGNMEGGMQ